MAGAGEIIVLAGGTRLESITKLVEECEDRPFSDLQGVEKSVSGA